MQEAEVIFAFVIQAPDSLFAGTTVIPPHMGEGAYSTVTDFAKFRG